MRTNINHNRHEYNAGADFKTEDSKYTQVGRPNHVCDNNIFINTIIIIIIPAYIAVTYLHHSIEPLGATLTRSYGALVHPPLDT